VASPTIPPPISSTRLFFNETNARKIVRGKGQAKKNVTKT